MLFDDKVIDSEEDRKKKVLSIVEFMKNKSEYFLEAFTHSSYLKDIRDKNGSLKSDFTFPYSYENLEFMGDSKLNFLVTEHIFEKFSRSHSEGWMSKLKQLVIRQETLCYLSKEYNLIENIRLGASEKKNNSSSNDSISADIFESFVAALYLEEKKERKDCDENCSGVKFNDCNFHCKNILSEFLNSTIFPWMIGKENLIWDYKSKLQEYCQAKKINFFYNTDYFMDSGNGGKKIFVSEISLLYLEESDKKEKKCLKKSGSGKSKKEAEQVAAKEMLKYIISSSISDGNKEDDDMLNNIFFD